MPLHSTCEHCQAPYVHNYTYRESRFCSRRCSARATSPSRPLADRFWEKVSKSDGCWLWTGATNGRYGHISRWPDGMDYAHRVSYELNVGPIPPGMDVRHLVCDNPPCVRPDHLAVGTRRTNMHDAVSKRRMVSGVRHHMAKLSDEQIQEICARYAAGGVTQAALAQEFGVSRPHVSELVHGRTRAYGSPAPRPSAGA